MNGQDRHTEKTDIQMKNRHHKQTNKHTDRHTRPEGEREAITLEEWPTAARHLYILDLRGEDDNAHAVGISQISCGRWRCLY